MGSALDAAREFLSDDYRVSSPNPITLLANLVAEIDAAPVVFVSESAVRGDGWVMFDGEGDPIHSPLFDDCTRVALLRVGEGT